MFLRHVGYLLLGLTGIVAVVSSSDIPSLWGINLLSYFSTSMRAVVLIALAVAGVSLIVVKPSTQRTKTRNRSSRTSKSEQITSKSAQSRKEADRNEPPTLLGRIFEWPILLALLFAGICYAFPLEWSLLGDGTLFIGYNYKLDKGGDFKVLPRELLSTLIIQGTHKVLTELRGRTINSMLSFQIIGAIAAFFWCYVSVKLSRLIVDNDRSDASWLRLLSLILLLTSGSTLLFFGYVEVYALSYAAALGVIYVCLRYARNECDIVTVLSVLALAMLLHLQNVLLLPGILFLIVKRQNPEFTINWKWVVGVLGVLLSIYIYSQFSPLTGKTIADNPFIPFTSVNEINYTLLSSQHLIDLLNAHLLLAPIALILTIAIVLRKPGIRSAEVRFIAIALFFFEAYLIGGNLVFGLARDWDAVAFIGPLFAISSILLLQQVTFDGLPTRQLSYALSFASLLFLAQWLTVNQDLKQSLLRYKSILETYRPLISKTNTHYGYENIRKVLRYFHPAEELHVIHEMLKLQPWPVTTTRVAEILADRVNDLDRVAYDQIHKIRDELMAMNDSLLLVEEVGEEKLRADVKHSANVINLADILCFIIGFEAKTVTKDSANAFALAQEFIRRHPRLPQGYELMAELKLAFNKQEDSLIAAMASKSIELDSGRPRPYLFLATVLEKRKEYEAMRATLRKALSLDPYWITATIMFAQVVESVPIEHRYKEDIDTIESSCRLIIERAKQRAVALKETREQMEAILVRMKTLKPLAN